MKKSIIKKLLIVSVVTIGAVMFFSSPARAQIGGGDCDVVSAFHRTTRPAGPNFYNEDSRPYVYIDIITQNCIGQSIQVSITEDDTQGDPDDDVNGTLGYGQICNNNFSSCMDNRVINVTSGTTPNFTLALIAGEDECEVTFEPECRYHLETYDAAGNFEWSQILGYNCDTACDDNWQYLGIIPYLSTHPNDPDAQNNNQQGGGGNTSGNGSSTPSTGPAVINLNLQNPISSVNSIPEFFQDVVNIIIKIAIPFTAIVLVYCGLLFVTARGDSSQLQKARNAFTYAVIGGLVLLASWLIAGGV